MNKFINRYNKLKKIINYSKLIKTVKPYVDKIIDKYPNFIMLYHNKDDLKYLYYKRILDDCLLSYVQNPQDFLYHLYLGYKTGQLVQYPTTAESITLVEQERFELCCANFEQFNELKLICVYCGISIFLDLNNSFYQTMYEISYALDMLIKPKKYYKLIYYADDFKEASCQLFAYTITAMEFGIDIANKCYQNSCLIEKYKCQISMINEINKKIISKGNLEIFEIKNKIYKILFKYVDSSKLINDLKEHIFILKNNDDIINNFNDIDNHIKFYKIKRKLKNNFDLITAYKYLLIGDAFK